MLSQTLLPFRILFSVPDFCGLKKNKMFFSQVQGQVFSEANCANLINTLITNLINQYQSLESDFSNQRVEISKASSTLNGVSAHSGLPGWGRGAYDWEEGSGLRTAINAKCSRVNCRNVVTWLKIVSYGEQHGAVICLGQATVRSAC